MPIQTSQITTDANGDLTIAPNGTGETKVASVDVARADAGTTEDTPVSVAQDGTVKKADLSTLPELLVDNMVATDLIAVQKADGDFYYVKAEELANAGLVNPPTNATLTITPTGSGGTGSSASPFVLTPVTVTEPGASIVSVETFAISGAPANGILYVTFTNNHGGRFQDKVLVADAAGNIPAFTLLFNDVPESAVGTVYTGVVRFGTSSVYCNWSVTQQVSSTKFYGSDGITSAPNGSPASVDANGIFGTGSGTWSDGTKALSSSANVQFQVNGGGYSNGATTASAGDTVDVIFLQSAVDAAADGATISGVLSSSDGTFSKTFSMIKDISPDINLGSVSNTPFGATAASSTTSPTGFNATTQITAGTPGANEMTSIKVSVDGGAFNSLPQNIYPGQTISVEGVVGSTAATTYTANVNIGNTAAVFTATTSAVTPTIQQPAITSPVDGSTGISATTSLASDAYVGNNSPGPHTTSAWEVYEADPTSIVETDLIQTVNIANIQAVAPITQTPPFVNVRSTAGVVTNDVAYNATYIDYMFDGNLSSFFGCSGNSGANPYEFTLLSGYEIQISSTLEFLCTATGSSPANPAFFKVNGTDVTAQFSAQAVGGTPTWVNITGFTELKSWSATSYDNVGGMSQIHAIRVDGNILGDEYTQLIFPSSTNFADFNESDLVQSPDTRIINIDSGASTIVVGGGNWLGTDGSGTAGGDTKLQTTVARAPAAPTTEPPDASVYTQVVNATNDPTNLTSYPLSGTASAGKAYYSRVKYKDNAGIESDFSDYNQFTT